MSYLKYLKNLLFSKDVNSTNISLEDNSINYVIRTRSSDFNKLECLDIKPSIVLDCMYDLNINNLTLSSVYNREEMDGTIITYVKDLFHMFNPNKYSRRNLDYLNYYKVKIKLSNNLFTEFYRNSDSICTYYIDENNHKEIITITNRFINNRCKNPLYNNDNIERLLFSADLINHYFSNDVTKNIFMKNISSFNSMSEAMNFSKELFNDILADYTVMNYIPCNISFEGYRKYNHSVDGNTYISVVKDFDINNFINVKIDDKDKYVLNDIGEYINIVINRVLRY